MTLDNADALFVGLISGTSMDGVDAGVFSFADGKLRCLAGITVPFAPTLQQRMSALRTADAAIDLDAIGQLDRELGEVFADAALSAIQATGLTRSDITAIGSHGQTVRHDTACPHPFTLQLGDPHTIAAQTGIPCVADFRRADVANGGEGAPLLPLLHDWLFAARQRTVAVVNLGGIANVTLLPPTGPITAFDTGPASTLMDQWLLTYSGDRFDIGGKRAAAGQVQPTLLAAMLADDYFRRSGPKSTGFEYFNLTWLGQWQDELTTLSIDDVMATLNALSVATIADALTGAANAPTEVWVAGGGVHNEVLLDGLIAALDPIPVAPISRRGIDADRLEAAGFAWLARERLAGRLTRHAEITGARASVPLGVVVAGA